MQLVVIFIEIKYVQSLLFIPTNLHDMFNTYIYRQLPPTCFDVRYTIFRESIVLLAQNLYACAMLLQWLFCKI